MWTEEMIREELRKLDEKTGLHGSELPIVFGRARSTLAYVKLVDGKTDSFHFSKYYFDSPDFAHATAMEIIAHEYAHYMDICRRGTSSHGPEWKACCKEIWGEIDRCFSPLMNLAMLALESDEPLESIIERDVPFADPFEGVQRRKKKTAAPQEKREGCKAA